MGDAAGVEPTSLQAYHVTATPRALGSRGSPDRLYPIELRVQTLLNGKRRANHLRQALRERGKLEAPAPLPKMPLDKTPGHHLSRRALNRSLRNAHTLRDRSGARIDRAVRVPPMSEQIH